MSSPRPVVVIGAGGFGREALDVIDAINAASADPTFDVLGVLDDAPSEINLQRLADRAVSYLGTVAVGLSGISDETGYVLGVGAPAVRARLDNEVRGKGLAPVTVVHPSASIGSAARLGEGAVICAGVQVSTNVMLGRSVHLNPNATIGHDAVLEDYVSINPGAIVSGECRVQGKTLVGAGAVILQRLSVGTGSVVGAGAVVVRNIPAGVTAVGVPARSTTNVQ